MTDAPISGSESSDDSTMPVMVRSPAYAVKAEVITMIIRAIRLNIIFFFIKLLIKKIIRLFADLFQRQPESCVDSHKQVIVMVA